MEAKRDTFRSQFGTIMSLAGMAIGLGNCRRFNMETGTIIMLGFIVVLAVVACALVSASVKQAGKQEGKGSADE